MSSESDYSEALRLRVLPGNFLLASFNFRTNGTLESNHMSLFPQSLNQVLQASHTKELHLKFTLGRWNSEDYGPEPRDGETAGGTGVELWAWLDAATDAEAETRWKTLTNALSGLFCASLNFIDSTRTIRPVMSFQPTGDHSEDSKDRLHLLHGSLPREPVCTENLTPFVKLLPCKGKVGVSSLLDGHKLFDAAWQAMSIDIKPVCDTNGECKLQMEQTVDMVVDVDRSLRRRSHPVPKPKNADQLVCDQNKSYNGEDGACFPLDNVSDQAFSLSDIFGKPVHGSCPLDNAQDGETRQLCLEVPEERAVFISEGVKEEKVEKNLRCYGLEENKSFDMILAEQSPALPLPHAEPLLYAERSFTGHGQERGGVQTIIRNPSATEPVTFVYLESLPWFMKPYLHTLTAQLDANSHKASESPKLIDEIFYRPALDRKRGTQLELQMTVPANSTAVLTYGFEKAILRYTEYPPDANRGFDVAPAIISIPRPNSSPVYHRTTSLLLPLPTPDFSMPYNVIILTSTVIALAFGSILNKLVRQFVGADEVERTGAKLRRKVKEVGGRLGAKLAKKKKEE